MSENNFEAKSILAGLTDWNFESFISMKLIRFFYLLSTIVTIGLAAILLLAGLAQGGTQLLVALVFVVVAFLLVIITRVYMELSAVIFKIGADLSKIANK